MFLRVGEMLLGQYIEVMYSIRASWKTDFLCTLLGTRQSCTQATLPPGLFHFPYHETTSSITTSPEQDASPSQITICQVSQTNYQYQFIHLCGVIGQEHNTMTLAISSNQDHSIRSSSAASPQEETRCCLTYCSNVHDLLHDIRTE